MKYISVLTHMFFLVILFSASIIHAQTSSIYIAPQIQKLYNGNTRSWDGKPGEEYWINRADYKINITLDVDSALIKGNETITYYNNSPYDLDKIVIQLFNNLYRKGNERETEIAEEDLTDGVIIKKVIVGEKEMNVEEEIRFTPTNMIISNLPEAYIPHSDSVKLYFEWETILPKTTLIRSGKYKDGVIFAAYFYPKVAVFDDIYGWDKLEYTGDKEFYGDFGSYDVEIKILGNYLVWGTGILQNAAGLFKKSIYDKYIKAQSSEEIIPIVTKEDWLNSNVLNISTSENIWKFKAENVSDFSFACSNHYLWDGTSSVVDDNTGRRVFVDAAYPDSANHYEEAALFTKRSVEYLSKVMPGFPFPYPKFTTFDNTQKWGGGMETPMMANDGEYFKKSGFITLLIHEIGHTYFPFMTGINERRYPWMDEGWASFFPTDYAPRYIDGYSHYKWYKDYYNSWDILGSENDLPLMTPSHSLGGASLTILSYARSFFAYQSLKDLLGEELFKKCLIEYINRWQGKHPLPYDFFFTFNNVSDEDLSWFWKPWFYEFAHCDLAISYSKLDEETIKIKVEKIGAQPVQARVKLTYDDGTEEIFIKNAAVWKNGNNEYEILVNNKKLIKRAEILTDQIPDCDSSNDIVEF